MRKQLKLLLLVATVLALFVMAMIVGSASDDAPFVVVDKDGNELSSHATFDAAYGAVTSGGIIRLDKDWDVPATVTFTKSVTIVGKTLDGDEKIEIGSSAKKLFAAGAPSLSITFKNLDIQNQYNAKASFWNNSNTNKNITLRFEDCDIYMAGNRSFGVAYTDITMHNCDVTANTNMFTLNKTGVTANLYLTGSTSLTVNHHTTYPGMCSAAGVSIYVGTEGGTDNVQLTMNTNMMAGAAGNLTVYSGTITLNAAGFSLADSAWTGTANIYGGTFSSTVSGATLFEGGVVNVYKGTFNLGTDTVLGGSNIKPEIAAPGDVVVNYDAAVNTAAVAFFAPVTWDAAKINGTIRGEVGGVVYYFESYMGSQKIGEYETFAEAYKDVQDGKADTVKLLADWDILASVALDTSLIIDGNSYTITGKVSQPFDASVALSLSINNATFVSEYKGYYAIMYEGSKTPVALSFTDCTIQIAEGAYNTIVMTQTTVKFHNVTYTGPSSFVVCGQSAGYVDVTITGNSTFTTTNIAVDKDGKSIYGLVSTRRVLLTIGTESGAGDNITFHLNSALFTPVSSSDTENNSVLKIYNGTFNFLTAEISMVKFATPGVVEIYGGTFNAAVDGASFFDCAEKTVTVTKANFALSKGATMGKAAFAPAAEEFGDITFTLGAGSSESSAAWLFDGKWVVDGMAKVTITGWNMEDAITEVNIKTNFTGSYQDYINQYCLPQTPNSVYGTYVYESELFGDTEVPYLLSEAFVRAWAQENDVDDVDAFIEELAENGCYINFVIECDIPEASEGTFVPFTVSEGAVVTLNGWPLTYAGTIGTVVNGTLILNNCTITGTKKDTALFVVNGESAILEVNGGTYDVTGLANTPVFLLGAKGTAQPNSKATFTDVTMWVGAGNVDTAGAITAYSIGELKLVNCLISPYKGIVKGNALNTIPEGAAAVNAVGVLTYATVTRLEGVEIHGGSGQACVSVLGGEVYATDLVTSCYAAFRLYNGTVNIYSGSFTNPLFSTNFMIVDMQQKEGATAVVNMYGGSFYNHALDDRNYNDYGAFAWRAAGGTVNVYGGSFVDSSDSTTDGSGRTAAFFGVRGAYTGAVVNIYKAGTTYKAYDGSDAVSTGATFTISGVGGRVIDANSDLVVNVEGAIFNMTGKDTLVVAGEVADVTITFTDCSFRVSQATTGVLFAAATFKGSVVVVAPVNTQVTADITLGEWAMGLKYAGNPCKLWISGEGLENSGTGAMVYVDTTANADESGLRFESVIAQSVIDKIRENAPEGTVLKYYTLIAPLDFVLNANGQFTKEALTAANGEGAYVAIPAVKSLDTRDGAKFSGTLVSLNSYTRVYAAVALIEVAFVDDEGNVLEVCEEYYGDFDSADNARSAQQVAQGLIDNAESEYHTQYIAAQQAIVDAYARKDEE